MSGYSVVIPAHNAEASIAAAVASAAGQSLAPDEIIVVDDGSRDGTAEAAAGATVIRLSANRGAAAARNVGIAAASSDRVAFLDADDQWLPDHLRAIDAAFTAVPKAAVAFSGVIKFGARHQYRVPQEVPSHEPLEMLGRLLRRNHVATSAAAVVRHAALAEGGMRPAFRIAHDYDLWLRLAAGRQFVRAEGWTATYRLHPGQLSAAYLELLDESWRSRLEFLEQLFPSARAAHQGDLVAGWEYDMRQSWTRRAVAELEFLLRLADRLAVPAGEIARWRRRRSTMRWLRWPLRLWDSLPVETRFRVARWRGKEMGDLV